MATITTEGEEKKLGGDALTSVNQSMYEHYGQFDRLLQYKYTGFQTINMTKCHLHLNLLHLAYGGALSLPKECV